ncbi:MAG: biotin-dependent carboxyltransferase family protein [Gemmatimonadaceae bacterium]
MISVTQAPPYLTVQDDGRPHSRHVGVPRGGAMDTFALRAGNALVGNAIRAAALEWALGGGSLRFETGCAFALSGATANAKLAGRTVEPWTATEAVSGDVLEVGAIAPGRFLYVAVAGGIDVPVLLGSRATYLPGKFGGHEGRSLRKGDRLVCLQEISGGRTKKLRLPPDLLPRYRVGVVHIIRGPQADLFDREAWDTLLGAEYRISASSDRTGYRLDGHPVPNTGRSLPSEPGCAGAIQIPGDGNPIVLMADAPTIGGYPKIAVVSEADLPIIAQCAPGDSIRFELATVEQSQRALRKRSADVERIRQLASS